MQMSQIRPISLEHEMRFLVAHMFEIFQMIDEMNFYDRALEPKLSLPLTDIMDSKVLDFIIFQVTAVQLL